ncbi:MAG: hypothetical protein EA360_00575 [Balneolaceae bacterium]|nr:MAG: hypothetical protein EA360_00575 [Balneolaceae bacterium]
MNEMNEEKWIKQILKETSRKMPFSDFEDEVMMRIEELESDEVLVKKGYRRGIAFSWVFFVIGIALGTLLSSWIPHFEIGFLGIDSGIIPLLFQAGFVLFVLLHFERLMSLAGRGAHLLQKNEGKPL